MAAQFDFLQFPTDAVAVVTGAASGIGRAIADGLVDLFLLAPASGYVNGVLLPVDGGSLLTL